MRYNRHQPTGRLCSAHRWPVLKRPVTKQACEQTGEAARVFVEQDYRTRKSWRCSRRVVAKAEHLPATRGAKEGKANARFVVTNLGVDQWQAQALYEKLYCARGDMENRIKEQQLDLFADRTSAATMRANQLRLYMSTMAYTLLAGLRRLGLKDTAMATAQCGTIRRRLLKIAARWGRRPSVPRPTPMTVRHGG